MNLHVHINRRSNSNSPAVAAVAASSVGFQGDHQLCHGEVVVVFKETTNSVNTAKNMHGVAGLCSRLRGGALIAAPGDINIGELDGSVLEMNDTAPWTDVIS